MTSYIKVSYDNKVQTIALYEGISNRELADLLQTVFNIKQSNIVGFVAEGGAIVPLSLVSRTPSVLSSSKVSQLLLSSWNEEIKLDLAKTYSVSSLESGSRVPVTQSQSVDVPLDNSSKLTSLSLEEKPGLAASAQVIAAGAWAKINENFIPPSLTFDREGYPSQEACQAFTALYSRSHDIHIIRRDSSVNDVGSQVTFLHIPGAGNSEIHHFIPGIFKHHAVFKEVKSQGYNCSTTKKMPQSTCGCHVAHVPPRYIEPWNVVFKDRTLFCVTREPIDRAIAVYSSITRNTGSKDDAIRWLQNLPSSMSERKDDSYCSLLPQYEFIWNENGERTCEHVLRYENGLEREVNSLIDAYGRADGTRFHMRSREKEHRIIDSTEVPHDIAAALRRFYWRDYCLLDYRKVSTESKKIISDASSHGDFTVSLQNFSEKQKKTLLSAGGLTSQSDSRYHRALKHRYIDANVYSVRETAKSLHTKPVSNSFRIHDTAIFDWFRIESLTFIVLFSLICLLLLRFWYRKPLP